MAAPAVRPRYTSPRHRGVTSRLEHSMQPSSRVAGHLMIMAFEAEPATVREYVPWPLELDGSRRVSLFTFDDTFHSNRTSSEHMSPEHVGHRYVWDAVESWPVLDDLVVHWSDDRQIGPNWCGDGWLKFYDDENEDVRPFQPKWMIGGWISTLYLHHRVSLPRVLPRLE